AAIAPSGEAETIGVDRGDSEGFVNAGEHVAKITVAEIAHVGARKGFALAEAAAGIWLEDKISSGRQSDGEIPGTRPGGLDRSAGTAVDLDNHGIFLRRIEITRIDEPALDVVAVVFPVNPSGFAPGWFHGRVAMRDLTPVADRARPDLRRIAERVADDG